MKKKIVYMGTPFFASEILEHLLEMKNIDVLGVVSQPDRKVSRKKKIVYSAVKESALKHDLPLYQPQKIGDFLDVLKELNPDAIITCAYGQFLPQSILDYNVINIHASLLPKYRGGAPMQYALMNGDQSTGVTLMKSILKMDAGPTYAQEVVNISIEDTLSTLELKLIEASKKLIDEVLLKILNQEIEPNPQDKSLVTFSPTISSQDEFIDFNRKTLEVYNHIRALIDHPYGYNRINGKRIKFTKVGFSLKKSTIDHSTVLFEQPEYFEVTTLDGSIRVFECQLEGKQILASSEIYNGYKASFNNKRLEYEN